MTRSDGRAAQDPRPISFERHFNKAAGSVLTRFGDTHVLCTASVVEGVPNWMKGRGRGWVTAEYGMLPSSTGDRKSRDRSGRVDGRSVEIQRLIGRSIRGVVDTKRMTERTIWIDCDVLQAGRRNAHRRDQRRVGRALRRVHLHGSKAPAAQLAVARSTRGHLGRRRR